MTNICGRCHLGFVLKSMLLSSLLLSSACEIVAGIDKRSPAQGGSDGGTDSGAGGTQPRAGSGGDGGSAVAGRGGAAGSGGENQAGQAGSAGSVASAGAGGSAGAACSQLSEVKWTLKEGEVGAPLGVSIAIGNGPENFRIELKDAPAWVAAPAAPTSSVSFHLTTSGSLPYDAAGSTAFEARVIDKRDGTCAWSSGVVLDVANVLHAPLDYMALPDNISYAAWHAPSESFYLLDSKAGRFFVLDTRKSPPAVGAPIPLPSTTNLASTAFAVSEDRIFVVADNKIYRLDLAGNQKGDPVPIESPAPLGALTLAHAKGFLLIGDAGFTDDEPPVFAPSRVLSDDENALKPSFFLKDHGAATVLADGTAFGIKNPTQDGTKFHMTRLMPGTWSAASCLALPSAEQFALSGGTLVWITRPTTEYVLNYSKVLEDCRQDSILLGKPDFTYRVVGLADDRALVTTAVHPTTPRKVDFALYDLTTRKEAAARLIQQNITRETFAIIMGSSKYALVVTSSNPLLIQL